MGWLSGWSNQVKLTVDQTDVDANLTNFPILLYLSASSGRNGRDISFIFDELQSDANRKKIAVTISDGTTECYVEIEKWDDANEQAWLWVKIPSISGTVDTDLYLYYDSTHADNTTYVGDPNSTPAETVWDSNFKFVSHMRDDPDTSHVRDSTSSSLDGTKKGAAEPAVSTSGEIADAQNFDGVNDYISLTSAPNSGGATCTLEAWLKPDTYNSGGEEAILDEMSSLPSTRCRIILADGYPTFSFLGADLAWHGASWGSRVTVGTWYHIVGVYDHAHAMVYVNGVELVGVAYTGNIYSPMSETRIGRHPDTGDYYADGLIDECRISDTNRSAAWIKASYETQRDHLLDWGTEVSNRGKPNKIYSPVRQKSPTIPIRQLGI